MVIYEDVCSGNPLSVKFSPYRFSPTCIRNGEMEAVFREIMPETTCYDMSQWVGKVVCYHFRFTGSTRSEVHQ